MAQGEKRENSVLFSLRELRQIEENRVQEEEQAVKSAAEVRRQAAEDAERRRREAEEAKIREEREAALAIETARENAEREARMRVESAEATERQRQQAALEQQRLQQEMELRRADIAKKRPTWMLVVTGIALLAAVGLVFFAIQRMRASEEAEAAKTIAEKAAAQAVKDAKEAQEAVEILQKDAEAMSKKVDGAVDALPRAPTQTPPPTAKAKLPQQQRAKYEMDQRIAEAKAKAARAERLKGVKISKECLDNPLAKGCN